MFDSNKQFKYIQNTQFIHKNEVGKPKGYHYATHHKGSDNDR